MTVWTPTDDGYADLSSHDSFVNGAPHNTFARLRRDDPMHWTDYAQGENYWSVTRHADIMAISRDPQRFANGIRPTVLTNRDGQVQTKDGLKPSITVILLARRL